MALTGTCNIKATVAHQVFLRGRVVVRRRELHFKDDLLVVELRILKIVQVLKIVLTVTIHKLTVTTSIAFTLILCK
jgi:hypothetical protein